MCQLVACLLAVWCMAGVGGCVLFSSAYAFQVLMLYSTARVRKARVSLVAGLLIYIYIYVCVCVFRCSCGRSLLV